MKFDGDYCILSSGRRFYAFGGNLSIDGEGDPAGSLLYGSDGGYDPDHCENYGTQKYTPFTPAERKEIAEYVIAVWKKWAGIE